MLVNAGFLQFKPFLGNLKANTGLVCDLIEPIRGVDLLVLPELSNSGYNFISKEQAVKASEEIGNSLFIKSLTHLCAEKNMHIVTGFCERSGGKLYNSSVLVGPEGVKGHYRKVHLFNDEVDFFEPGDLGFPVFKINDYTIGMLICFDWMFPEAWRILALQGADIVCHPSNLVLPYCQQAVAVHSLCNKIFTITANRTGTEEAITFTGQSIITAPDGRVLLKADAITTTKGIIQIDIAEARNKQITNRNHIFDSRRPDQYDQLIK